MRPTRTVISQQRERRPNLFSKKCQPLIDFITEHSFFCVIGHEGPDLDCLCSQLVLASFLKHIGKEVHIVSHGPFSRTDVRDLEPLFQLHVPLDQLAREDAGVLLVDCASLTRTGFGSFPCDGMAIDHHACTEDNSLSGYIDSTAPSATLLVYRLLKTMGHRLTMNEAELVMMGFCADSGFFRHLTAVAAPFMPEVGELLAYGISIEQIYEKMEGRFTLASRQYMGKLLSGCQSYADGQLIVIVEENWDPDVDRDTASIYRLLLSVEDVEVVMIMRRKDDGYSAGLRSRNDVDVGQLAAQFGGGGHARAAGFFTTASPVDVKNFFINVLRNQSS